MFGAYLEIDWAILAISVTWLVAIYGNNYYNWIR